MLCTVYRNKSQQYHRLVSSDGVSVLLRLGSRRPNFSNLRYSLNPTLTEPNVGYFRHIA
jgi:hypothetical protein